MVSQLCQNLGSCTEKIHVLKTLTCFKVDCTLFTQNFLNFFPQIFFSLDDYQLSFA